VGLFSALFGESKPQTVTQKNTVELSKEQKELFNIAKPFVTQAAKNPLEVYPGVTLAGFNPTEQAAQQNLLSQATGTIPQLAQAGADANAFMLDPSKMLDVANNQYVKSSADAIMANLTQNLQRNILPQIGRQTEVNQGPYGATSRQGIREGIAIGDTSARGGQELTKLYSDAYGQGLTAMGRAQALNPQTIASMLTSGQVQAGVGEQMRGMEQAGIDEAVNKFYLQQQLPMLKAQDILGLMGSLPGGAGVSTVTGAQPQTSKVGGALGGAAAGASIGSAIPGIGTTLGAGIGGLLGLFT
jgi:hypothetical protein